MHACVHVCMHPCVHVCVRACGQYHASGTGRGRPTEDEDEKSLYIIDPFSLFHTFWDLGISALLFLMLIMVPLNFFDAIADSLTEFNLCVDVIFMV